MYTIKLALAAACACEFIEALREANRPALHIDDTVTPKLVQDWVNFVIFDESYIRMAQCWYHWFLRSTSPEPLLIGCIGKQSCKEAQSWEKGLQGKVDRVEVIDLDQKYALSEEYVPKTTRQLSASYLETKGHAVQNLASDSFWPRDNYIKYFNQMMYDQLVGQHKSVLHIDVDALWLRPPDDMLREVIKVHNDADIIVSRCSSEPNPEDLWKKWGFILNVGFIMYRNTTNTLELFEKELLPSKDQSCQQLLNHALDRKGCTWSGKDDEHKVGWCGNMKIVALRENDVSRDTDLVYNPDQWHPIISHPDTGRLDLTNINRMSKFKDMNLCSKSRRYSSSPLMAIVRATVVVAAVELAFASVGLTE